MCETWVDFCLCLVLDVHLFDLCFCKTPGKHFVSSQAAHVSRSVEDETKYIELMVINDHLMVSLKLQRYGCTLLLDLQQPLRHLWNLRCPWYVRFLKDIFAVCTLIVIACKRLCTVCSMAQDAHKDQPVMLQTSTLKSSYKSGIIHLFCFGFFDPMKIPHLKSSNLPFSAFGMFWPCSFLLKTSKQAQIYLTVRPMNVFCIVIDLVTTKAYYKRCFSFTLLRAQCRKLCGQKKQHHKWISASFKSATYQTFNVH